MNKQACSCNDLIVELIQSAKEQARLLAAQNDVMGKIIDQNTELMAHLISSGDEEVDPNRSLD